MPAHPTKNSWTDEQVALLIKLADERATVFRASAALGRRMATVQRKARQLGKPLDGVRKVRASLRATEIIESIGK